MESMLRFLGSKTERLWDYCEETNEKARCIEPLSDTLAEDTPTGPRNPRGNPGELNRKLSDSEVRALREWSARHPDLTWRETGEGASRELGIALLSPKTVERICLGVARAAAGGPLASPRGAAETLVRCAQCGTKCIPPCLTCRSRAHDFIAELLVESGLADEDMVADCAQERMSSDPTPSCIAMAAHYLRRKREAAMASAN